MSEIVERFTADLADVPWKELRIHLQRDAIIIVADHLDLVSVAVAVTADDKEKVESWIRDGLLVKPTAEQASAWEQELEKPFRVLIVQPFILVQIVNHA